jgi:putative pyruvate formate lyase activating enzyme
MLLPGFLYDSKEIVKYLFETYGHSIYISIMSQYTPHGDLKNYPEIDRTVTKREYSSLVDFAVNLGIENAFIQGGKAADESFIPHFDGSGI